MGHDAFQQQHHKNGLSTTTSIQKQQHHAIKILFLYKAFRRLRKNTFVTVKLVFDF